MGVGVQAEVEVVAEVEVGAGVEVFLGVGVKEEVGVAVEVTVKLEVMQIKRKQRKKSLAAVLMKIELHKHYLVLSLK